MTRTKKRAIACVVGGVGLMLASAAPAIAEVASFYSEELRNSPTASGAPYDPDGLTAAHKTLPLGTRLLVKHKGRGVAVTVTDRGPYTPGRDLDLSAAAARTIGLDGVEEVEVSEVPAPEQNTSAALPDTGGASYPTAT